MSKFNTAATRAAVFSPVTSETSPSSRTFQGAPGYGRDTKSELFLLAVANMVSENTFYENGHVRDDRYVQLVRDAALADPAWTAGLLRWLRTEANMRSASLVGAAEFLKARLGDKRTPTQAAFTSTPDAMRDFNADSTNPMELANRDVIASVLQRADEPAEMLAYWTSTYGRKLPMALKRGVADAARRLYTERSLLKYDTDAHGYRFGDVIDLVHPTPVSATQSALFKHAIDRRHGRTGEITTPLWLLRAHTDLMALPVEQRRAVLAAPDAQLKLNLAGMTWESLAGWLQGPMNARAWEAVIPSMGYMALLRNLRNFDEAGVSDEVAATVAAKLADPAEVLRSRQFPMRFLSAYRAAPSLRWSYPLEQAITLSLGNIPHVAGRTLILVDTSDSMNEGFSKDGTLMRWDAAALFGIALASRCAAADVVSFSMAMTFQGRDYEHTKVFPVQQGESLLRAVERWKTGGYFIGAGTDTAGALRKHFRLSYHDRVVILTDEQAAGFDVGRVLPPSVPLYTWNLAGYEHGHAQSGVRNRHTFAGLTDQAFRMIPLLESGRDGAWPWETTGSAA